MRKIIATLSISLAAVFGATGCLPGPTPPPPVLIPPITRPVCAEEPGDLTPKVLEFEWLYPQQLTPPTVACTPERTGMQLDVWIQHGTASDKVFELLCASIGGILRGPIDPHATWVVCMAVRPSAIGIPSYM